MTQEQTSCQLCQQLHRQCISVRHYDVVVCPQCKASNQDGWQPAYEPILRAGLSRNSLLIPDRTAGGLLPFTYSPPADFAL